MGKPSRDKGKRVELEIVNRHREIGVHAERVPLSGMHGGRFTGDIDIYALGKDEAPLIGEVKARKNGQGFTTIENWLAENDLIFLRRDRQEPMVVLPWRTWVRLIG